jgi:hypothetical protein
LKRKAELDLEKQSNDLQKLIMKREMRSRQVLQEKEDMIEEKKLEEELRE